MARGRRPPSQSWKTFLRNHAAGIAAMDLLVVPTIGFRLLYVLIILGHHRRRLLSFGITSHPTAEWIARQITDAFPWTEAPRYLIRDRDAVYGQVVTRRLKSMGIRDRPTAPRSPWQNGYVERLIGSIRRECLDHVVVLGEAHLRRIVRAYVTYYNEAPNASLSAQGCSNPSTDPAVRADHVSARPRWPAPPILSDVVSGRDRSHRAPAPDPGSGARGATQQEHRRRPRHQPTDRGEPSQRDHAQDRLEVAPGAGAPGASLDLAPAPCRRNPDHRSRDLELESRLCPRPRPARFARRKRLRVRAASALKSEIHSRNCSMTCRSVASLSRLRHCSAFA
jgi:hypothetical protein